MEPEINQYILQAIEAKDFQLLQRHWRSDLPVSESSAHDFFSIVSFEFPDIGSAKFDFGERSELTRVASLFGEGVLFTSDVVPGATANYSRTSYRFGSDEVAFLEVWQCMNTDTENSGGVVFGISFVR